MPLQPLNWGFFIVRASVFTILSHALNWQQLQLFVKVVIPIIESKSQHGNVTTNNSKVVRKGSYTNN